MSVRIYGNWERMMEPEDRYETCPVCSGFGSFEVPQPTPDDPYRCEVVICEECGGSGYVPAYDCMETKR